MAWLSAWSFDFVGRSLCPNAFVMEMVVGDWLGLVFVE